MKLPSFKRLYDQDFKEEDKDLIRQLAVSINSGIEVLYEALNKKVSMRDNVSCTVKDFTVTVDSAGKPLNRTSFSLDASNVTIDGCQVIRATNNSNSAVFPSAGIFLTFTQTNSGVEIQHVTGIPANNQFTLRVIAYHQ